MSSAASVCRACLFGDVSSNCHSMADNQLLPLYEKLTNTKLRMDDRMPGSVCSICHWRLVKFKKFSEMVTRSENILLDLLSKGVDKVTLDTITALKLDRTPALSMSSLILPLTSPHTMSIEHDHSDNNRPEDLPTPSPGGHVVGNISMYNMPVQVKIEVNIKQETNSDDDSVKTENVASGDRDADDAGHERIEDSSSKDKLFHCEVCPKQFSTVHLLKSHLICHSGEKPHTCPRCSKSFSRRHNMVQHMRTCISVKEPSGARSLSSPSSSSDGFYCEVCNRKFSAKSLLKSHLVSHSGQKPHCCEGCQKPFARKQGMKQHMLICSAVKTRAPVFRCTYCSRTFVGEADLSVHLATHSKTKPYSCEKCHKAYTTKPNMRKHLKLCVLEHEEARCELCPRTFSCRSALCKHLNAEHAALKPFCCERCSARFWYKSHLTAHLRIHTGEKPFACEVCGRTFTLRNHLRAHLGTHSGEKPHACGVCGKAFLASYNLREHMHRHTGERPHVCRLPECGKAFAHQSTLRQHVRRVHAPARAHACARCPQSFADASLLATHMRVHTAPRTHACSLCDKTFFEARHLKGHMQVHSELRPHACGACGAAYKRPEHLKQHVRLKCKAQVAHPFAYSTSNKS